MLVLRLNLHTNMRTDIISIAEATTYLQSRGITDSAIVAEIMRGSQNHRLNIALQADTYHFILRNRKPSALDFRAEFEPLTERYVRQLEIEERDMLRILANVPIWDKEIAEQVLKQFYPKFSVVTFAYIMGFACMCVGQNDTFSLLAEIRDLLLKDSLPFPKTRLSDFLFDIYDKKIENFLSENLTPFQTQLLELTFQTGAETEDLPTFCLWFEHKSALLETGKQYALLLSLNEKLAAVLSPHKAEFLTTYNQSLYKKIYYNMLLGKNAEARKVLQTLSPAQMAEFRELYERVHDTLNGGTKEPTKPTVKQGGSLREWLSQLEKGSISDIEKGDLHYQIAQTYLAEDEEENAFFHIKAAYQARRSRLGDAHEDTVDCLILMGKYYQKKENWVEAMKHFQKALDISLKNGRKDALVPKLLFDIADMSIKRKDYQKAVDYFKRCVREWKTLDVELNEMIADCHFKMGYVHDEVRNWEPALQQYIMSLEMRKILWGETDDKVADVLHNIGTVYYNWGVYAEAVRHLSKAINVRIEVSNIVRRPLALSYYNIALAFIKMNRKPEAKNNLEKAVAIFDHIDDNQMNVKAKNMMVSL